MHATTCWPLLLIIGKYRVLSTYSSVLCFNVLMPLTFSGVAIFSTLALGSWLLSYSPSISIVSHFVSMQPLWPELDASRALIQFKLIRGEVSI